MTSLVFTLLFGAIRCRTANSGDSWSGLTWINHFYPIVAGAPGRYPRLSAAEREITNEGRQIVRLMRSRSRKVRSPRRVR